MQRTEGFFARMRDGLLPTQVVEQYTASRIAEVRQWMGPDVPTFLVKHAIEAIDQRIESGHPPMMGASGNTWYVSQSSGSDANNGNSTGTAWKTLAKVAAAQGAATIATGDTVCFKMGDVWSEGLVVSVPGVTWTRYGNVAGAYANPYDRNANPQFYGSKTLLNSTLGLYTPPHASPGTEQLTNASLDTWAAGSPTGWTTILSGSSTVTQDSVTRHTPSGSSAKIVSDSSGNAAGILQTVPVTALRGQLLTFSFWVNGNAASKSLSLFTQVVGGANNGNYITQSGGFSASTTNNANTGGVRQGVWQKIETTILVPSDATSMTFQIKRADGNATWWVDDASIATQPAPNLLWNPSFDIWSLSSTQPDFWVGSGTGEESVSQETTKVDVVAPGSSSVHLVEGEDGNLVNVAQIVPNIQPNVDYILTYSSAISNFNQGNVRVQVSGGPMDGYYLQNDGTWSTVLTEFSSLTSQVADDPAWQDGNQILFTTSASMGTGHGIMLLFDRKQVSTDLYFDEAVFGPLNIAPPPTNIYRVAVPNGVRVVARNGVRMPFGAGRLQLTPGQCWWDSGYLYVCESSDPSVSSTVYEYGQLSNGVTGTSVDSSVVANLYVNKFNDSPIVFYDTDHLHVQSCDAHLSANTDINDVVGSIAVWGATKYLADCFFDDNRIVACGTDGLYGNNILAPHWTFNTVLTAYGSSSDCGQIDNGGFVGGPSTASQRALGAPYWVGNYISAFGSDSAKGGFVSTGYDNGYAAWNYHEYGNWIVSPSGSNWIIEHNVGYQVGANTTYGAGVYLATASYTPGGPNLDNILIRCNTLVQCYIGVAIWDGDNAGYVRTNIKIHNNTIVGCTVGVLASSGSQQVTGECYNNIVWNCTKPIQLNAASPGITSWLQDYNLIGPDSLTVGYYVWRSAGGTEHDYSSLAAWVSGTGFDTHSTRADPLFVEGTGIHPDGTDYRLTAASPAINTGKDIGDPYIGSAPDIGAWEYSPTGSAGVVV